MNYQETIDYLFAATPNFQQQGGSAYKPGLERVLAMAAQLGNPHKTLRTIHIGGTNGKGSTSSTLAAVLMSAGYKTGLFTSPHLVDFRERIRVNGTPVSKQFVVDFVAKVRPLVEKWSPSFFELTTLMAFAFFAEQKVDIAIIEVGMGGRLDSTNIITPLLSVITNISLDHTQFLGTTLTEIAREKAGIMKPQTPVVIGEAEGEVQMLFAQQATALEAPIYFASQESVVHSIEDTPTGLSIHSCDYGSFEGELGGAAQHLNTKTILTALRVLSKQSELSIPTAAIREGFSTVVQKSHLLGRWQSLSSSPRIYCDTGHNEAGIRLVVQQLQQTQWKKLHIVFGMVADKDWYSVLALLPHEANYYFVTPPSDRGLPTEEIATYAHQIGLQGKEYPSVSEGFAAARIAAHEEDLIYIGGSNYVVAEVLRESFSHLLDTE